MVARPGASPDPAALTAHVRERLAGYKCPDVFEIVDELPRTSTGKVRKYELREREWAGRGSPRQLTAAGCRPRPGGAGYASR